MKIRNYGSASARRRLIPGGIAILMCILAVADPSFARGRFGGGSFGGGGFDRGSFGGGGFDRHSFGGGGFDRHSFGGGGFDDRSRGGDFSGRGMNSRNVESRQEGRTDRTRSRQSGASTRSYNRTNAWSHSVNHWGGAHYWGGGFYGGAAFVSGMLLGMAVASLPPHYETVYVTGSPYYYTNGVYNVKSGTEYTVVPAPVGVTVVHPPAQVTNVYVNGENLGYANGAYYKQVPPPKKARIRVTKWSHLRSVSRSKPCPRTRIR